MTVLIFAGPFRPGLMIPAFLWSWNPWKLLQSVSEVRVGLELHLEGLWIIPCVFQAWADAFRSSPDLTGVVHIYEELKRKGIEFPMADLDALSPIHTPQRVSCSLAIPGVFSQGVQITGKLPISPLPFLWIWLIFSFLEGYFNTERACKRGIIQIDKLPPPLS